MDLTRCVGREFVVGPWCVDRVQLNEVVKVIVKCTEEQKMYNGTVCQEQHVVPNHDSHLTFHHVYLGIITSSHRSLPFLT